MTYQSSPSLYVSPDELAAAAQRVSAGFSKEPQKSIRSMLTLAAKAGVMLAMLVLVREFFSVAAPILLLCVPAMGVYLWKELHRAKNPVAGMERRDFDLLFIVAAIGGSASGAASLIADAEPWEAALAFLFGGGVIGLTTLTAFMVLRAAYEAYCRHR